jgi:hypothetical protein
MEVHAHTHTPAADGTGWKKFKHYLWEFLMLFLAVFCGFLAENQREQLIEHQREKQYIRSLKEDLESDIAQLSKNEIRYKRIIARLDSMATGFNPNYYPQPLISSYRKLLNPLGFPDFIYTDRTMQQLKNAGGMRLIRKLWVADSIAAYDAEVRRGIVHQDMINTFYMHKMEGKVKDLFDNTELRRLPNYSDNMFDTLKFKKTVLLSNNKTDLIRFVNELNDYSGNISTQLGFILTDKRLAQNLLKLIKKEYHLN